MFNAIRTGALVVMTFAAGVPPVLARPPEIWGFKEFDVAVLQAKEQGRPLFLMFGFKGCTWCEYLYRRGMNDDEVRSLFQANLVLAYYDTKAHGDGELVTLPDGLQITHKQFIERLSAYPTPSWVYFSPSGQVLASNRNGRTTAREFRYELQRVLAAYRPR